MAKSTQKNKRLKITDVIERFLRDVEVRNATNTLVSYRQRLKTMSQLLVDLCKVDLLDQVEVDHLRQCVQYLLTNKVDLNVYHGRLLENGSTLSISTVRSYIRVWKVFFSWCAQEDLININPADGSRFKPPKPTKKVRATFTDEHLKKMLAVFDTSDALGFRNYAILVLFLDTGMRLSEIVGLRLENVHEDYVKVLGKGRREREIGIYPETRKLLWKYVNKYRMPASEDEKALFIGRAGRALSVDTVKYLMRQVQHDAGLDDIPLSAHVFRHTFAKMYLENGGDLFKLSRELGHSDVQTTRIYLEDFGSAEARKDHTSYSPIARLNLKRQKGKRKK